jgi:glycosyltransferase involved in cell wall biosynthesis
MLPQYRQPFFDHLAGACKAGLSVFAGEPRPEEAVLQADALEHAQWVRADNRHILRGGFYLCVQAGIEEWLATWDPDVLILEANPRYPSNRAALRWMKARGRPAIGWGLGAPRAGGVFGGLIDRWRLRSLADLDALIAYSTQGAVQYHDVGYSRGQIFIAPNAVRLPATSHLRTEQAAHPLRMLFVGRLIDAKRVDLLLHACSRLEQTAELHVVGDGPSRPTLEQLAQAVFPETTFHGTLTGEALDAQFDGADVFVLPGTGGLAVQEAMAHALPVIVGEGDGTQRDLVSAHNGWLVPAGDVEGLAGALRAAQSDLAELRAMGERSFRLVRDRFNLEEMRRVFVQALHAVSGLD